MLTPVTRPATEADIDAMLAIKQTLRPQDTRANGGFILGTDRASYRAWIGACTYVLQCRGKVGGYAICLPDAVLRASPLWQKRDGIVWTKEYAPLAEELERDKIAYFEQLATLPAYRHHALFLAVATLGKIFGDGHKHLFLTTLRFPFVNTAAASMLRRCGAKVVGQIAEFYPAHGRVTSAIHHLRAKDYRDALLAVPSAPLRTRLQASA